MTTLTCLQVPLLHDVMETVARQQYPGDGSGGGGHPVVQKGHMNKHESAADPELPRS